MGDLKSLLEEEVMQRKQRQWVLEEQERYVQGLLSRTDDNARKAGKVYMLVYMLRNGLTTLWQLSQGKPRGSFVSQKQIKAKDRTVKDSATAGLWA